MKTLLTIFILSISVIFPVNAIEMGIVTGSKTGTYIQMGKNISDLVAQSGITLKVIPSRGSLDNIADVFETRGVQLGIVQSDVLSFIRSQDDAHLKKIAAKIKMVFPLYNEEVHILATQKIDSLSDLAGATVAIGKDGSGTFLTAKVIFEITGIQPKQVSRTGGTEALNQLLNGDIDAMFYVAGYPVSLFKTFQEEKFHLLSITDKSISEYYVPSTIPANTYPFQEEAVPTVAVKAVLMTYNYRRLHCKNVGKIAYIMYHNKHWLQTNGHAKWKEVNFDYPLKQWEQYSCVKKAIQSNASATPAAATTDNEESNSRSTLRKMLNNW